MKKLVAFLLLALFAISCGGQPPTKHDGGWFEIEYDKGMKTLAEGDTFMVFDDEIFMKVQPNMDYSNTEKIEVARQSAKQLAESMSKDTSNTVTERESKCGSIPCVWVEVENKKQGTGGLIMYIPIQNVIVWVGLAQPVNLKTGMDKARRIAESFRIKDEGYFKNRVEDFAKNYNVNGSSKTIETETFSITPAKEWAGEKNLKNSNVTLRLLPDSTKAKQTAYSPNIEVGIMDKGQMTLEEFLESFKNAMVNKDKVTGPKPFKFAEMMYYRYDLPAKKDGAPLMYIVGEKDGKIIKALIAGELSGDIETMLESIKIKK